MANNPQMARARLEQIITEKAAAGWPDFFVYGRAIALESEQACEAGQAAEGLRLAEAAVALAPHSPGSQVALAGARWDSGELLGATSAVVAAVALAWTEPPLLRKYLGNGLLALVTGLIVSLFAFSLVALYRYGRLVMHDLRHLLPAGAVRWQALLIGLAVLAAPVLFRLGVAWWVLIWVALMGIYFQRHERIGGILVLGIMATVPVILPKLTAHLAYPGSRSHDVYLAARGLDPLERAERLESLAGSHPNVMYAQGLRAQWSGDLERARGKLEAAVKAGGDAPELFTSLGNIRFRLGDKRGSIEAYKQAVAKDPQHVVAHFNMSRAYYTLAEHQKAGVAHRRATAINLERVEAFSGRAKQAGRGFIVPERVPWSLLNMEVAASAVHLAAVDHLWSYLGGRTPRLYFSAFAILGVILLVVMALLRAPLRLAVECPRCGVAACRRCNPEMPDLRQCGQCFHAFVSKEGVGAQLRIQKEIEVHRHQASTARLTRLFSLLLAGAGQLIKGSILRGVAFMTVFVASLVGALSSAGLLPDPAALPDSSLSSITMVATSGIALVIYLVALWDGARET